MVPMLLRRLPCFTPRMFIAATTAKLATSSKPRIDGSSKIGNSFAAFVANTVVTAATAVVPSSQVKTPVRNPT